MIKISTDIFSFFAFSIICGLLIGSIFEGYLFDLWSFPKYILILLIVGCFYNRNNRMDSIKDSYGK